MKISIEFAPEQVEVTRTRLSYAFRLFCALYGHQPLFDDADRASADLCLTYRGRAPIRSHPPVVSLVPLYRPRPLRQPAPPPHAHHNGFESTMLVYPPEAGGTPDWLGEIFEWVSCAGEYSVRSRDAAGRIPFADSYAGRHRLDVRKPYAAVAMRCLQQLISATVPESAPSGLPAQHFAIVSHDVDYLPAGYFGNLHRLAKNAAISLFAHHSPALAVNQAWQAARLAFGGANPLDQLPHVIGKESGRSLTASFYFLAARRHRRDGNYDIDDPNVVELMRRLEDEGSEIGVHGSYTSLDEPDGLAAEFGRLRDQGFEPAGTRQHWLRFTLDRLIPEVEKCGALYDSSLGWADRIGFRAGACFAYPPYDFGHERPAGFLEIPLIVMDQALLSMNGASELLAVSRKYGWGGVSLLWHPTAFGGGQLPQEIGRAFWTLLDENCSDSTWVSAETFVRCVRRRYEAVGLLCA